jgi:Tfp pilus assembly protein FimT
VRNAEQGRSEKRGASPGRSRGGPRLRAWTGRWHPGDPGQAGLTATELVIILAIIAILAAAAYPQLSNVLQVMASKGAAEQTTGAIRLARQFAITKGKNHCIEFGPSAPYRQYRIREANTAGTQCDGTIIPGYDWQDISHQETVVTTATTMIFDPIGNRILPTAPPINATFSVDTSPASCLSTVTVTLYGGVQVQGC